MGSTTLTIHANVEGVVNGVNQVTSGIDKLNSSTEEYKRRSQAAFKDVSTSSKMIAKGIDQQEKELKQLTQEYLKLASVQSKWTAAEKKRWKEVNSEIDKTKNNISLLKSKQADLGVETSKGSSMFKRLGASIGAAFTVGAVIRFAKEAAQAYMQQEKAEAKLKGAIGGRVDVQKDLIKQADQLQRITLFKDDDIINAQALLAINIKDKDQLKELVKVTLDLAAAKGMDLASAAQAVNMATMGQSRALKSLGIELDLTGTKEENIVKVTEALRSTVGGMAEEMAGGMSGSVHSFNVAWDELLESFGNLEQSGQGVLPFLSSLLGMISTLNNDIAKLGANNFWNGMVFQLLGNNLNTVQAQLQKFDEGIIAGSDAIERRFKGVKDEAGNWIAMPIDKPLKELQAELIKAADANIKFAQTNREPAVQAYWQAYKEAVIGYTEEVKKSTAEEEKAAEERKKLAEEAEKERRKRWDEEQARIKEQMALEELLSETRKRAVTDIQDLMKAEEAAAEAEKKKLAEQQAAATALLVSLNELTKAYQDEANVDDIPFDTEAVVKEYTDLQKFIEENPLFAKLGFKNEEQLQQVKDYIGQLADFANQMIADQVAATERIVEDQNQRIDEQQALVDNELKLKEEGLANDYELEKQNLEKMQKARDAAIKDRERMIKIQRTMSTVESGIALVSSAANIIKGFSSIPVVGVVLGLAAVAAMIAGFIAMSAKAKDAVKMERGGLLIGKRHSQGGIPVEAEDKEFFVNRNSSQKYLPLLEAINKDDRAGMKLFFDRKFINKMPQQNFDIDSSKKLGEIVRELKKGKADIIYGDGFIMEKIGGYTKKIYIN